MTTLNTNNQDDNLDDLDKVILATSEIIKEAFNQIGETEIGQAVANKISIPADFAKIIEATENDGFTGFVNKVGEIASGVGAGAIVGQILTSANPFVKVTFIVAGSAISSDYYKDNIAPQVETLIDNIADGIDSVNNLVNEFIDSIQDPDGSSIPPGDDWVDDALKYDNTYYTKLEEYNNQLKAIIEQDLPAEELAKLQQEVNSFKSAYTDKAEEYQTWNEDYTNYQEFKQQYDNWQQEDATWREEYQELAQQTQVAESEKDTAQQNYNEWVAEYQEWYANYNNKENSYTEFKNNYDTQVTNYNNWLADTQHIVSKYGKAA
jgi:chemotaxis protein histidine kinase CheA